MQNSMETNTHYIEKVYERLLEAITRGELKPGERVRQAVLAERLGVSRQPISHALQLLRHQGLLRDAGKQGVEVTPVNDEYIFHLYQARVSLEPLAASLSAERIKNRQAPEARVEAMRTALEIGHENLSSGAPVYLMVKADSRFHMSIYQLSGNSAVSAMMAGQWPHLMRSMLMVLDHPAVPTRAWEEHATIARHILNGSAAAAAEAATQHVERARLELIDRLKNTSRS
ncbi:GntR family transcriptional regulator [Parapusillimonas granuli]|uniref:GntR family transcriptional regulator n=2 Tax=Parapusillimonas granuli TaxID=380911 RepID=A0A853FSQ2_9BURK|nr:GntR family transcriptional regulator [Parapusillimonas granuli]